MSDLLPVVGIDVSKATLDVHWSSQKGKRYTIPHLRYQYDDIHPHRIDIIAAPTRTMLY